MSTEQDMNPEYGAHRSFASRVEDEVEEAIEHGEIGIGALFRWVRRETGWVRRLLHKS